MWTASATAAARYRQWLVCMGSASAAAAAFLPFVLCDCCLASGPNDRMVQVLHIDRNNYYGGVSASLSLSQVRHGAGWAHACSARRQAGMPGLASAAPDVRLGGCDD